MYQTCPSQLLFPVSLPGGYLVVLFLPPPPLPDIVLCHLGGYPAGYEGISRLYEMEGRGRGLVYLQELYREGYMHGNIMCAIGQRLLERIKVTGRGKPAKALGFFRLAAEAGYNTAHEHIYRVYWRGIGKKLASQKGLAVFNLVVAHKQGLGDDRILRMIVTSLQTYKPRKHVLALGRFKDTGAMALYYSNLLIQQNNPHGYHLKSSFYYTFGPATLKNDIQALRTLEEADELGLLDFEGYKDQLAKKYQ